MSWSIQGNIVHATGNPFRTPEEQQPSSDSSVLWLGRGLCLLRDHVLTVNEQGIITSLEPSHKADTASTAILHKLKNHEFLCPGMIDLHIHAPQFAYTGTATDRPLTGPKGWLETYAFVAEKRLKDDLVQAQRVYQAVVQTTLKHGTTTAVYFATLDLEPCKILVDEAMRQGQRALIGKVCMDRNSPVDYCQSTRQNLDETKALIQYIYRVAGKRTTSEGETTTLPRILPLITPRFIPTCTPELLQSLGALAESENCHITSHISESLDEVEWSRHLDGDLARTDAAVFDSHKLLTDQCIMAHGVWLDADDRALLRKRGSGVAHCPLSNFFFANGSLTCRELMQEGTKVGLGTDVAGGYNPSLLDSSRLAVVASRALQHQTEQASSEGRNILDYRHAFYLATLGGAEALNLQDHVGNFAVGKQFDAVVLTSTENIFWNDTDGIQDIFQKICNLGDDRNVVRVFVAGQQVA